MGIEFGASTGDNGGAGIVLTSASGKKFNLSLDFKCSNNEAEYEALLI